MARHDPEGRTCRARSQRRRRGRPCPADQVRRVILIPSPVLRPLPLAASDLHRRSLLGGPARLLARRQNFAAPRKLKAIIQARDIAAFRSRPIRGTRSAMSGILSHGLVPIAISAAAVVLLLGLVT